MIDVETFKKDEERRLQEAEALREKQAKMVDNGSNCEPAISPNVPRDVTSKQDIAEEQIQRSNTEIASKELLKIGELQTKDDKEDNEKEQASKICTGCGDGPESG